MERMRRFILSGTKFGSRLSSTVGGSAGGRRRFDRKTLALGGATVGTLLLVAAESYRRETVAECDSKMSKVNECDGTGPEVEEYSKVFDKSRETRLREVESTSIDLIEALMDKCGSPGLTIAVNIDGEPALQMGFGYADVENAVRCKPETVMRIASIGKTITMAMAAKLLQTGQLDLDRDVREYVDTWPQKSYKGEKTDAEVYSMKAYANSTEALTMFKDDQLCSKPGSEFMYSTHGWTLVSAVIESIAGKSFDKLLEELLNDMSLKNTYLDKHSPIITNRARFYTRKDKGTLVNSPYVDPSYKYSGGGLLSTVLDIATFGDVMLYSYQSDERDEKSYLRSSSMKQMWTPVEESKCSWDREGKTGLSWAVVPEVQRFGGGRKTRFYVSHTGGGIGSSSVLLILPRSEVVDGEVKGQGHTPKGVTVSILTNMQNVGLNSLAKKIAFLYADVDN